MGAWIDRLAAAEAVVNPLWLDNMHKVVESMEVVGKVAGCSDDVGKVGDAVNALCCRVQGTVDGTIVLQDALKLRSESAEQCSGDGDVERRTWSTRSSGKSAVGMAVKVTDAKTSCCGSTSMAVSSAMARAREARQ